MRAGKEDVLVELINIYDVSVLVGMEFVGILIGFFSHIILVLKNYSVRIPSVECIFKSFHFVEDWGFA